MKFSWGHGVVVALAAFMIFILCMIFLFPNGQKNSELISDNYYEEELQYQDVIDAKKNADALQDNPTVQLQNNGINIAFPNAFSNHNSKFNFYLFRTDDKNLDVKKDFKLRHDNTFLITKKLLVKGSYTLKLKWNNGDKNYQRDFDIQWK